MNRLTTTTGKADAALDQLLSDELDTFNASATPDVAAAKTPSEWRRTENWWRISGWTWGRAAGIGMSWVREDRRGTGVGARFVAAFEGEAVARGCTHVFGHVLHLPGPGFYQRLGCEEIFRWESVPTPGRDDVHMRKEL